MIRLKIIYRKNLHLSPGKLAAQCVHAAAGLGHTDKLMSVVVLGLSDKRYYEEVFMHIADYYRVFDAGLTEVDPGTETCAAFYEEIEKEKL